MTQVIKKVVFIQDKDGCTAHYEDRANTFGQGDTMINALISLIVTCYEVDNLETENPSPVSSGTPCDFSVENPDRVEPL